MDRNENYEFTFSNLASGSYFDIHRVSTRRSMNGAHEANGNRDRSLCSTEREASE